jgi:hypothetical protein
VKTEAKVPHSVRLQNFNKTYLVRGVVPTGVGSQCGFDLFSDVCSVDLKDQVIEAWMPAQDSPFEFLLNFAYPTADRNCTLSQNHNLDQMAESIGFFPTVMKRGPRREM